jgi:hypothetical protein
MHVLSGTVATFQFNLPTSTGRPFRVVDIPLQFVTVTPETSYQPHLSNPSLASDFSTSIAIDQAPKKRKHCCEQDDMMTDDEEIGCKVSRHNEMQWTGSLRQNDWIRS